MRVTVLLFVQVCACAWRTINGQLYSYRAAVLEFAPHTEGGTITENWQRNLNEYLQYIQDASNQRAQIIVLPENGLSGYGLGYSDIEVSSTELPDPDLHILPCTAYYNNNYSSTLRELSCAARNHKIYVVANLIEKVTDHANSKKLYYNTNVALNKNGEVIARHRKMHLYNEPYYATGDEVTTFATDFGVTFGMFVCADILFEAPSQEVLRKYNVTDVVYSGAWFSALPFLHSLSIQHGYSKSNGVNLLAAGMNNPKEANGGSGIYLADGRIAETFISGIKLSKLIVQDVPKISTRTPNNSCKLQKMSGAYKWGIDPYTGNISSFYTTKQDMADYTFKTLNVLGQRKLADTICSSTSSFCCNFNVTISRTNSILPNYVYKIVAFQGVMSTTRIQTIGLRHCAIVACTGENDDSCGDRNAVAPRGVRFEDVSVTATLDNKEVRYEPYTLTYDLKPASDYTFCVEDIGNDKVDVVMTTTDSIDSLLAFGLTGRVFKYDQQPAGLINNATANRLNVILLLIMFVTCVCHARESLRYVG